MDRSSPHLTLHVGTMKSGTTYLQRLLLRSADGLGRHGWSYPVIRPPRGASFNHEAAFFGLAGSRIPWITPGRRRRLRPTWDALETVLRSTRGSVVLSAESLAALDGDAIRHVLDRLPYPPVRVVITCRDLGRVIPSSWQQHVRNGRLTSYEDYLCDITVAADGGASGVEGERFWRSYRLGALVRRWAAAVGAERVRLVTVPRSAKPDVLWQRFADACGMPESLSRGPVPDLDDTDAHRSVGQATAVVMQEVAARLLARGDSPATVHQRLFRIARTTLASGWSGAPIRLPGEWIPRVRAWARRDVDAALTTGVRIEGDWNDLLVPPDEVGGQAPAADEIETARALARVADPEARAEAATPACGATGGR